MYNIWYLKEPGKWPPRRTKLKVIYIIKVLRYVNLFIFLSGANRDMLMINGGNVLFMDHHHDKGVYSITLWNVFVTRVLAVYKNGTSPVLTKEGDTMWSCRKNVSLNYTRAVLLLIISTPDEGGSGKRNSDYTIIPGTISMDQH